MEKKITHTRTKWTHQTRTTLHCTQLMATLLRLPSTAYTEDGNAHARQKHAVHHHEKLFFKIKIRGPGVALGLVTPFARAARTVFRGASRGFAAVRYNYKRTLVGQSP